MFKDPDDREEYQGQDHQSICLQLFHYLLFSFRVFYCGIPHITVKLFSLIHHGVSEPSLLKLNNVLIEFIDISFLRLLLCLFCLVSFKFFLSILNLPFFLYNHTLLCHPVNNTALIYLYEESHFISNLPFL